MAEKSLPNPPASCPDSTPAPDTGTGATEPKAEAMEGVDVMVGRRGTEEVEEEVGRKELADGATEPEVEEEREEVEREGGMDWTG